MTSQHSATAPSLLDPLRFRDVIGRFASGVTIITTNADGRDAGATASAVSSLSAEPPMVLVCLNRSSATAAAVREAGVFAVNVLAEDHAELAVRFAGRTPDKFDGVAVERAANGAPLLVGALAHLVCRVSEQVEAGTHFVFLAHVDEAVAYPGHPLAYFRGAFGRMQTAPDAGALAAVRDHVLHLASDREERVTASGLADLLRIEPGLVHHALVALASETLVRRDGEAFVVEPVPENVLFDYYQAKLALEIGVAWQTIGRVGDAEIARMRELAEATAQYIADNRFTDAEAYNRANDAFHDYMVGLAGSSIVSDVYRRLGLPGIERRTINDDTYVTGDLVSDHRALVDAYAERDLDAVVQVLREHAERPRRMREIEHGEKQGEADAASPEGGASA